MSSNVSILSISKDPFPLKAYLGSDLQVGLGGRARDQDAGVVLQGAHDAALGAAVAVEVHAAARRRVVVGVDVVVRRREGARRRVPVAVGPRGHAGQVVGAGVAQQALEVRLRRRAHVVAGHVGHRLVAHGAPGQGAGQRGRGQEGESCEAGHLGCCFVCCLVY